MFDSTIFENNDALSIEDGESNGKGGGIYMEESNPVLKAVQIIGNTSSNNGGGLYCKFSNPIIQIFDGDISKINNLTVGFIVGQWEGDPKSIASAKVYLKKLNIAVTEVGYV